MYFCVHDMQQPAAPPDVAVVVFNNAETHLLLWTGAIECF